MDFLLPLAGIVAGFVDSIAGGGGLISVPVLSLVFGPGAEAIATNKVIAVTSTLVALLVYARGGHVSLKGNRRFILLTASGAIFGALASPLVPREVYRWFLVVVAPIVLWIMFKKDLWVKQSAGEPLPRAHMAWMWSAGLLCGFYDGIAGPGGGTVMFLSLFVLARLPLLTSMATAKIANLSSASLALVTFALTGHVNWSKGLFMAMGVAAGASVGASLASKNAVPWARGALLVVSIALILRLALMD